MKITDETSMKDWGGAGTVCQLFPQIGETCFRTDCSTVYAMAREHTVYPEKSGTGRGWWKISLHDRKSGRVINNLSLASIQTLPLKTEEPWILIKTDGQYSTNHNSRAGILYFYRDNVCLNLIVFFLHTGSSSINSFFCFYGIVLSEDLQLANACKSEKIEPAFW